MSALLQNAAGTVALIINPVSNFGRERPDDTPGMDAAAANRQSIPGRSLGV
jgi:hypothetical protein